MATIHFDPIGKFKYTKDDMGNYHSYNDKPAIEYLDRSAQLWFKNGLLHRENKPAIVIPREFCKSEDGRGYRNYDEYFYDGIKYDKPKIIIGVDLSFKMEQTEKLSKEKPELLTNEIPSIRNRIRCQK